MSLRPASLRLSCDATQCTPTKRMAGVICYEHCHYSFEKRTRHCASTVLKHNQVIGDTVWYNSISANGDVITLCTHRRNLSVVHHCPFHYCRLLISVNTLHENTYNAGK